jgi:hypothetical protein
MPHDDLATEATLQIMRRAHVLFVGDPFLIVWIGAIAFCVSDGVWPKQVLDQSRALCQSALTGIAAIFRPPLLRQTW